MTLSLMGSAGLGNAWGEAGWGATAGGETGEVERVLVTAAGLISVFIKVLFFGILKSKRRTSKVSPWASSVMRSGNILANLYPPI
jgi:hypothetical protein